MIPQRRSIKNSNNIIILLCLFLLVLSSLFLYFIITTECVFNSQFESNFAPIVEITTTTTTTNTNNANNHFTKSISKFGNQKGCFIEEFLFYNLHLFF